MKRLIPRDAPRLRTRLATYAIALVAIPLGFAWGYLSKDWPVRHRLWALWLVAPVAWGWAWLARLAWIKTLHWTLRVGAFLSGPIVIIVMGCILWNAVLARSPRTSTPAVQSPRYPPDSTTAKELVAHGLLTPTGEVAPMVRELLREKALEGWHSWQMTRLLEQQWSITWATELVTRWYVTDTVLTPEGKLVPTPAPAMPTSEPRHRAVVR